MRPVEYFDLVARNGQVTAKVGKKDLKDVVNKLLLEASSDPKRSGTQSSTCRLIVRRLSGSSWRCAARLR